MAKEEYRKELIRMFDSLRKDHKGETSCEGVECRDCPLYVVENECRSLLSTVEVYNAVERWSKEHPKLEYKVSKTEYDILRTVIDYSVEDDTFDDFCTLSGLLEKGYFKGANLIMNIREYYKNCEVVDK